MQDHGQQQQQQQQQQLVRLLLLQPLLRQQSQCRHLQHHQLNIRPRHPLWHQPMPMMMLT